MTDDWLLELFYTPRWLLDKILNFATAGHWFLAKLNEIQTNNKAQLTKPKLSLLDKLITGVCWWLVNSE